MLYYTICYILLYYIILYVIFYYIILYYMLYSTILYYTICYILLYYIILYAIFYYTILYYMPHGVTYYISYFIYYSPADVIEFVHAYNESGNFTVYLESINNVSRSDASLNVTIQDPCEGLHFATNSPVTRPQSGPGVGEIYIYWNPAEALFPTGALSLV